MVFSGQAGPGAEAESGPGSWSSEAEGGDKQGASEFLPEQLSCRDREG